MATFALVCSLSQSLMAQLNNSRGQGKWKNNDQYWTALTQKSKDVFGIKCSFCNWCSAIAVWMIWSRSSGFQSHRVNKPKRGHYMTAIMLFDWATFMTIWTLRAKLEIQLVNCHMVTWTVDQFTGRCRTVWPSPGCSGGRLARVTQCPKEVMLQLQLVMCPVIFFSLVRVGKCENFILFSLYWDWDYSINVIQRLITI